MPGAADEYSTGGRGLRGASGAQSGPAWRAARRGSREVGRTAGGVVFTVAIVAALVLAVAEFTTLYQAHIATRAAPIKTVTTGSHNAYAMLPIAALAALLALALARSGSRAALLAVGALGVIALLIALLHDLPDAHAVGLAEHNSVSATTTPNAGLYLETAGAILLIATSGLGFLLSGPHRAWRGSRGNRPSAS